MSTRFCACGCGASLSGLRADAVYASESCSKRAKRAASADKGRTRRESRNGYGTRIYLTAQEIAYLERAVDKMVDAHEAGLAFRVSPSPDLPPIEHLKDKLGRAAERVR